MKGLPSRRVISIRDILFCSISTVLLILSFPRVGLWPLAWIAFVPIFIVASDKKLFSRFLYFYIFGVIFFFGTLYWLIHVTLVGMIALVLYLAIYFGLFGLFISGHQSLVTSLFWLPAVWVLLEYARSHMLTGFCWVILGHSQYLNLPIIQISDLTGAYGVSFLLMIVNVAVWQVFSEPRAKSQGSRIRACLIACILIFATLIYGYFRLHQKIKGQKVRISIVQGNIPQELKWVQEEKEKILEKHISLSMQAKKDNPDLVIWPETAMPVVLELDPFLFNAVSNLAKEIKIPLLTGTMRFESKNYFNSALLFSEEGKVIQHYDKLHLVPFGEYIPLRQPFVFLERLAPIDDFTAGKDYAVFHVARPSSRQPPFKFSVLICFEDIFPELARSFVKKGAGFLVNITNDAWFKDTAAPCQHLQSSVFRAVENRVFLIRSANTGVSGFISPKGKIISLVKDNKGKSTYVSGYDTQEIIIPAKRYFSFYTRFGDIFALICLVIAFLVIIKKGKFEILI